MFDTIHYEFPLKNYFLVIADLNLRDFFITILNFSRYFISKNDETENPKSTEFSFSRLTYVMSSERDNGFSVSLSCF